MLTSNAVMWAAIVAFLLPNVIAVLNQTWFPAWARSLVAFAVAIVVAAVDVLVEGNWSWHAWLTTGLLVLTVAISTYNGFWKVVGIAPLIERLTTFTGPKKPPASTPRRR